MRITTAKRYYNGPANVDNNGIVIDTSKYLIDIYLTRSFKLSTAYVPADEFSGKSYIAWLGWLHIEITGHEVLEA
jgi:hypothetical protein